MNAAAFENFLLAHKHDKTSGHSYTHTRIPSKEMGIPGGSYYIPDEHLDEFYKLYTEKIKKGRHEHLTEKQRDDNRVICIDLDFKYDAAIDTRQHSTADILIIVSSYAAALAEVASIPADMQIPIYVMEKPDVNTDDEKYTKDGIHILFGVSSHFAVQYLIRNIVLETLPPKMTHLTLKNSWDDVMDDNLTRLHNPVGWTLYGSRKPANDKYELTHVYYLKEHLVEEQDISTFDPYENIELLSVRNRNIPVLEVANKEALETVVRNKVRSQAPTRTNSPSSHSPTGIVSNHKSFIDKNCPAKAAEKQKTWWWYAVALMRYYGAEDGRVAVHYFSSLAKEYDYENNKHKVDQWLDRYEESRYDSSVKFGVVSGEGVCYIDTKLFIKQKDYSGMIINDDEDKNFTTICEKIVPYIREVLVFCMENWYSYSDVTHLWTMIKEPQKIIKEYLFLCVSENNKHIAKKIAGVDMAADSKRLELIALQKQFLCMYSKIESLQVLTLVKRDLMISLADDEFVNKLDDKAGKLVFKNGIYDIASNTFREGLKYEDNLSFTLPYNYRKAKSVDIEKAKKEIMKICANQEWRYKYYMECLGFSMMGTPEKEQAAFFMVGCGGNGKSLLLEALEKMMPKYVVKLSSKTFSKGNQDFKKNINSMKGARIAWINEVEKIKQDIDLIKAIADGTAIKNPVLYKQIEEHIKILAKLFFVSNLELSFASDGGIKRRYRYVEFVAKFHKKQIWEKLQEKRENIDFEADTGMLSYFTSEDGFFALLELILEGARRWIDDGELKVPEEYEKLADKACEKNEAFAEFVDAHIVKSVGNFVSRFEIEERYKMEYNTKLPNEKTEFREYMASKGFGYDCKMKKKVDKITCNGCYLDCVLTNITASAVEEE